MGYSLFSCVAFNSGTNSYYPTTGTKIIEAQSPTGTGNTATGTPGVFTVTAGALLPQFAGKTVVIGGTNYTLGYTDSTHGTLTPDPGNQTGITWTIPAVTAEEVAQDKVVEMAGGTGAGWECNQSSWLADVDYDATSGGNPIKVFQTTVLNGTSQQFTKTVLANDQGTPVNYAANVALETLLTDYGFSATPGTCNTSGTAVTATAGITFTQLMVGLTITINSVNYTVQSVTDGTHLTLTSTAGTQTGVSFSFPTTGRSVTRQPYIVDVKAN